MRDNYIDGLLSEKAGYQHRINVAKEDGDDATVKRLERRIAQVDEQLANEGWTPGGAAADGAPADGDSGDKAAPKGRPAKAEA